MSDRKRRISIRKIIQTLVTIIVVTGTCMAIISADRLQNSKKVHAVDVRIRNANMVHFLSEKEIVKMLFDDRHLDAKNTTLRKLDIRKMEHIIRSNPWVSDAQVFIDNERDLHVFVTQRVPVVRIFETNNNSYYLDSALKAMPVSEHYVHYTPLVTGTPAMGDDSTGMALKGSIVGMVQYISQHRFWNAQIAQIVMTPDRTFELIPVLGKQRVIIGDTSRLENKLSNLLAFYTQVQNKVGWEKYEVIDLRYEGQVVASPALKWKAPVDRALSNMNWVKAVMEAGPKNEKDEAAIGLDSPAAPVRPAPATTAAATPKPAPANPRPQPAKVPVKPAAARPKIVAAKPPKTGKPVIKDTHKPLSSKPTANRAASAKPKPAATHR